MFRYSALPTTPFFAVAKQSVYGQPGIWESKSLKITCQNTLVFSEEFLKMSLLNKNLEFIMFWYPAMYDLSCLITLIEGHSHYFHYHVLNNIKYKESRVERRLSYFPQF